MASRRNLIDQPTLPRKSAIYVLPMGLTWALDWMDGGMLEYRECIYSEWMEWVSMNGQL